MRFDQVTSVRAAGIRRGGVTITAAPTAFNAADCIGYRHCAFLVFQDFSGGGKTMQLTVEDSDDNATWRTTSSVATFGGTDPLSCVCVLADASKLGRYIRLSVTAFTGSIAPVCSAVLFNEINTFDGTYNVDVAVL